MFADAWLFELFAFGTVWFWLLLTFLTIVLFYCADNDSGWLATFSVVATAAAVQFFGGINLFSLLWANKLTTALLLVCYFIFGTVWAVGKWWFFVTDQKREYEKVRNDYTDLKKLPRGAPIPAELKDDFKQFVRSRSWGHFEINTQVSDHKSRIYIWMVYWPWSAVWTLINDPVRRIFNRIYDMVRHRMQAISDYVWADTKQDLS